MNRRSWGSEMNISQRKKRRNWLQRNAVKRKGGRDFFKKYIKKRKIDMDELVISPKDIYDA